MTDNTELKRVAESANAVKSDVNITMAAGTTQEEVKAVQDFLQLAMPKTILALIADNDRLNAENKQLILLECHGGTAQAAINLLAERDQLKAELEKAELIGRIACNFDGYKAVLDERDQLKAEVEALRQEREGKVLCELELFETLRDSANTEADEHRQCMATYRPLRQENLDSVVKKCDDLLAAMGKGGQS